MFVDLNGWPPPGEPQPRKQASEKWEERLLTWLVVLGLLLWFLSPIAGASVIHSVLAVIGG